MMLSMDHLLEKARAHYSDKLPFVLFNNPNSDLVEGLFQRSDQLYYLEDFTNQKGFVMAPFKSGEAKVLLPLEKSERHTATLEVLEFKPLLADAVSDATAKARHMALVAQGIQAIGDGAFEKVVLSRDLRLHHNGIDPL